MKEHRYILEPYKGMNTRYHCPECKQSEKTFSCYIDTETGKYLSDHVGRCERVDNCGYHYTPKQFFQDNKHSFDMPPQPKQYQKPKVVKSQPKPVSLIPIEIFKASLKGHEENNFVKYLSSLFGAEITGQLISSYFIGTSNYQFRNKDFPNYISERGATVFWQIDISGKVRTGKTMLYSPSTGKRIKEPFNHIGWAHKAIKQPEFELRQCFFGEHLLQDTTKPVAIVESEKTAVIASAYLPQFIWLAAGSKDGLNTEKCNVLNGRAITLFPDINCFEKWSNKARELSHLTRFMVSNLLECKATETERKQGLDLADYLIKFNYTDFILPEPKEQMIEQFPEYDFDIIPNEVLPNAIEPDKLKPESWDQEIVELETFFEICILPTGNIQLDQCTKIIDTEKFIDSHFAALKANNGNKTFLPGLHRLEKLKKYLTLENDTK